MISLFPYMCIYWILSENATAIDLAPILKEKNYTAMRIVNETEEFFTSLGWPKLPKSFKTKSMFVRPKNKTQKPTCQGSAWDFMNTVNGSKDVRYF